MHLNRFGFNILVIVYLAPLVLIDFFGNSLTTDSASDWYFFKCIFDGILCAYAIWQVCRGSSTVTQAYARERAASGDEIVSFENIGAFEWSYCLVLSAYAAVNLYFLHEINKATTGLISMGSLLWSALSIAICLLAFIHFYHLKSGKIVELRKRMVQ